MGLDTQQQSSPQSYASRAEQEWASIMDLLLQHLGEIPQEMLHRGPSFAVETRSGEPLTCETLYFNFVFSPEIRGKEIPTSADGVGIAHYVLAKNTSGDIVGTRVSSIFYETANEMLAKSRIAVKYREKGLAMPIENAFVQSMQWLSNKLGKIIVWKVSNENLDTLELIRAHGSVPSEICEALESEQRRWQAMYGPGGKVGINEESKRIFHPSRM